MPISEDRLQVLVPRQLKRDLVAAAKQAGLSVGAYIRRLLERDLKPRRAGSADVFPFGQRPIRTGRKTGSIDHDRIR